MPPGSFVNLGLSVDRNTARQLHAQGPRLTGVVKAVDPGANTVQVGDTTYPVARDAILVIDGKVGSLSGLPTGASVNVSLRVDHKTVGLLQTTAP